MLFSDAIVSRGFCVLADIKPRSPEHGDLFRGRCPVQTALRLEAIGCPCLTNVTEPVRFGGSIDILRDICHAVNIPVIRKDFIKSADDIVKTREAGAAGVLVCCATLTRAESEALYLKALEQNLEPLVEVHTVDEMAFAAYLGAKLIGINNRDIVKLETDGGTVDMTATLIAHAPKDSVVISESGILVPEDVKRAKELGADAVLVGSALLLADDLEGMYKTMSVI